MLKYLLENTASDMDTTPFNILCSPKRVVLASVDNQNNGSPISPMANLKLLTKVATSYMDENANDFSLQPPRLKKNPVKNQRQLRSLGYICKKFLELYNLDIPVGHSKQISLGQLTLLLEIEKRRVYDIINIIASLRYATKVCKDKYSWFGSQYLIPTLCELRILALDRNYHLYLQRCLNNNFVSDYPYDQNSSYNSQENPENDESQIFDDNRIGALCQKSMMLFLIAPKGEPLNFKIISHIILPKDVQDKTGMRRLYDISNVLESLGLIRRCDSKHMKRPTFIYSGPELPDDPDLGSAPENRLTDIEHLSDTSSDGSESKIPNIFDFVCTEIQELEKKSQIKCDDSQPATRKRLFPELHSKPYKGFIKAPQASFKYTANGLVRVDSQDKTVNQTRKFETQAILAPAFPTQDLKHLNSVKTQQGSNDKSFNTIIRINKIAKPVTVVKFSVAPIQNGSIYKVVKQGNIINLVKVKASN